MTADDETTRLANYLLDAWPYEIGSETSESAVDVAIRLLRRLKAYESARSSDFTLPEETP